MARCNRGYEFCVDCANQELDYICEDCDDGSEFEPLAEDAATFPLTFMRLPEAA